MTKGNFKRAHARFAKLLEIVNEPNSNLRLFTCEDGSYLKLIALTNQIGGKYPTLWCIRFDRFKDRHYVNDILSLKDPEKIRKRIMSFGTEYILDKNL